MSVLYIVLPLALVVVLAAVAAFLWATDRGQFDDLDTPALRMLHDDRDQVAVSRTPRAPSTARRPPVRR
jgi:cbb3-type cytochrome oxidase maturation protein